MKNNNEALAKIMNNVKLNYNKKKTDFDRIAIIHSMNKSNARRSVCINKKRSDIIEFINNEGKPNIIYQIVFNHIA